MGLRYLGEAASELKDIAVIYTDLDGTMLGPRGSFIHAPDGSHTTEPVEALIAAQRAGIDVVPTSGRALRGLQTDARLLGMSTVIAEMGALTSYDFGREVVTLLGETPGEHPQPAKVMEEMGIVQALLDAFPGRLEPHTPWSTWREYTQLLRGSVNTDEADALLVERGFEWVTLHDNGRLHGAYLEFEAGASSAYHLMPRGMSKGHAVGADLRRRGIDPARAVAIGDAHADLGFAHHVGTCVLVGDAVDHDPLLAERCGEMDNVLVTERPMNLGWTDLLKVCAAHAS